jgi:cytochrome c biogenesis protein CcmG, thiol:disulfide interchange protein DsbE
MDTYYTLLDVPVGATAEAIEAAYQHQRERYSPDRVATLGEEFRQIAEARTTQLERAYTILVDPARRREYDQSIGVAPSSSGRALKRTGISRRELMMAAAGASVGLLVIALFWVLSGGAGQQALLPVARVNKPAPDFALSDLNGQTVRLSDYRGKTVLVNFWYTGCEPCQEETPALQATYQKLSDQGLVILGVDVRGNERSGEAGVADVRAFAERYGVTYPIVFDEQGDVGRAFQVYVLPSTFFVDPNGTIQYASFSAVTTEDVERVFRELQQGTTASR